MGKEKILVALSGGVDSAVSAYLLKEQKYDVEACYLDFVGKEYSNQEKAHDIANYLDIPFYVVSAHNEFHNQVLSYFVNEYLEGRTPNPCALCNRIFKFEQLIRKADDLGIDRIATGHYAQTSHIDDSSILFRGTDRKRDQSYFLFNLKQSQLKRTLFPIGSMSKEEIRLIATKIGLPCATTPDSQDICFLSGHESYQSFLRHSCTNTAFEEGNICDTSGRIWGTHKGLPFYTIGQRRGLHLDRGGPWFVLDLDVASNTLIVGKQDQLFSQELLCKHPNWIVNAPHFPLSAQCMIRYRQKAFNAIIQPMDETTLRVIFETPQGSVTPGQAIVFYHNDVVLGGAWITTHIK